MNTTFRCHHSSIPHEGQVREMLASYFLSGESSDKKSRENSLRYKDAIRLLSDIELQSALQTTGIARPLRFGCLSSLIYNALEAAKKRLSEKNISLDFLEPNLTIQAAVEPRILQLAVFQLLKEFQENGNHQIQASVISHENSLTLSFCGEFPLTITKNHQLHTDTLHSQTLDLIRETARIHKGGVVISENAIAFSINRDLPSPIGLFATITVESLLRDPLSPLNVLLPKP